MTNLFISSDALPADQDLFLGPLDSHETVYVFDKRNFAMADLAVISGFFPSKGQARKNGWSGEVPLGYGAKKCGKRWAYWFNCNLDNIGRDD